MWFFNKLKWKKRKQQITKKEKYENLDIKRPENSYDIYNQNETLTLKTDLENEFIVFENEMDKIKTAILEDENKKTDEIIKDTSSIENQSNTKKIKIAKTTKQPFDNTSENQNHSSIYIIYEKNDSKGNSLGWQVKKENSTRASKTYKTKEQTIEFVKNKAINNNSTCIIKKNDGSIAETIVFEAKNLKNKK